MLKNLKAMLIFSVIISLFISCTKDIEPVSPIPPPQTENPTPEDETIIPEEEPNTPGEEPNTPGEEPNTPGEEPNTPEEQPGTPGEQPGTPSNPGQPGSTIELGTGSGDLTIDGNDATVKGKSLIIVKAGTYGVVSIKNINGAVNAPVFIKNGGQVTIRGALNTENITNVTIAGDNVQGIQYGFNIHDVSYRAMTLTGKMSGVTLKNLSFKNVGDYVIYADLAKQTYQGTAETRTERFKILNSKFDNASGIQFSGTFSSSEDKGFLKDLEIAHNTIVNSNGGVFAFFPNVQDYDIHHNIADNLNPTNNNHNGIFQMIGNGKFHDNKFTNYQGNMIRAWVFSRGNSPSTIEFYNNIAFNTRTYGAFEIQGFDRYIVSGKSTFVNAKVYNNTVGKMNTSKQWVGVILDLYNYGGTLEFYNNLGFDLYRDNNYVPVPVTEANIINNMSDVKIIRNANNKYFPTSSDAVTNTTSFASKHQGIGASL